MNERILELAEQAGASVSTIGGIFINKTNLDIEKFAKLIIQECASFIDSHEQLDKYGEPLDMVYGEDLLQHFGVSE
jgi:hypothetical protein